MNLTAPPATMMTQGAAIRPKRRPDPVPISVLQVWAFATHPTPARRATCLMQPGRPATSALSRSYVVGLRKGPQMKKTATSLPGAMLALIAATVSLAFSAAFAQSHTPPSQSAKPPTEVGGGARARAFDIQNGNIQSGTMRSLEGWTYQSQTGTYFNPRTGVTCPASGAGCF
jgi:hypothetical protein